MLKRKVYIVFAEEKLDCPDLMCGVFETQEDAECFISKHVNYRNTASPKFKVIDFEVLNCGECR